MAELLIMAVLVPGLAETPPQLAELAVVLHMAALAVAVVLVIILPVLALAAFQFLVVTAALVLLIPT
jgi:hypothetical protein